jgi:hypothetical protein
MDLYIYLDPKAGISINRSELPNIYYTVYLDIGLIPVPGRYLDLLGVQYLYTWIPIEELGPYTTGYPDLLF